MKYNVVAEGVAENKNIICINLDSARSIIVKTKDTNDWKEY
jgi:hypothetical protein